MLVVIALNRSSEELPGMLDVAFLGVGSLGHQSASREQPVRWNGSVGGHLGA